MNNKFILTINIGSSSIKFSVFNLHNLSEVLKGKLDFIDKKKIYLIYNIYNIKKKIYINKNISYKKALNYIVNNILVKFDIKNNIKYIGHRVVHGGFKFKNSIIINNNVLLSIKKFICFSPIHNKLNLIGIKELIKLIPNLKNNNFAVFDTSFYFNIPKYAYLYAIPYYLYKKNRIRKYGAHGISHNYILKKFSKIIKKKKDYINIISCHLGNGSSISIIKNGKCIDTTMGLTPLDGLIMGTRSGDIDPYIIFYLNKKLKFSINKIRHILSNESGLLGLTNISNDIRVIEKLYIKNNYKALIAINMYCYRIIKYISFYISILNKNINAIIFTGGIGENSSLIRKLIINKLLYYDVYIDINKNIKKYNDYKVISTKNSKIPIFVINSNEEKFIAEESLNLFNK